MNDTFEKNGDSLAIVDKKPPKPGGCVGIFFKIFDWNRRLAKKKLFSMKLLPPVKFKQSSNTFGGGNEQQGSKHRLIADENRGGFPKKCNGSSTAKVQHKHDVRVPGLVARLMGLESMPSQRGSMKKIAASDSVGAKKTEKFPQSEGRFRLELRPQKLQKTSVCERPENLLFRNSLSKSRKLHPTKLPTPVKSSRNHSRKASSKLIGAATKILEPGLQRSKLKCAITYSNNLYSPSNDSFMEERLSSSSPMRNSYGVSEGQPSCRNCGYFEDTSSSNQAIYEQPFIFASPLSHYVGSPCQDQQRSEVRKSPLFQSNQEKKLPEDNSVALYPFIGNVDPCLQLLAQKSPFGGQIHQFSSSQQCKLPMGVPVSVNSVDRKRNPNRASWERDEASAADNLSSPGSKRRSSGIAAPHIINRMECDKFELEKRIVRRANASLQPGRKRRSTNNICRDSETSDCSTLKKHNMNFPEVTSWRKFEHNYHVIKSECYGGRPFDFQDGTVDYSNVVEESMAPNGLHIIGSTQKSTPGESCNKRRIVKPISISGDKLGAILQQKLKDLHSIDEEFDGSAPKKSTATILEELISALTSEVPPIQNQNPSVFPCSVSSSRNQAHGTARKLSVDQVLHDDHSSPGSTLEAYFSAESCLSSSVDDSIDLELLDSAASKEKSCKELVMKFLRNVSETLFHPTLATFGMNGSKHEEAKMVLLNAELFLHNAAFSSSIVGRGSLIKHLLIDELETLANILWMKLGSTLGVSDGKEMNELKKFALDATLEYLNLRFERDHFDGCSKKLPIRISTDVLIFDIVDAVGRWSGASQFSFDELIDHEMSSNSKEWTTHNAEIFEYGMDFSRHLLENLVDEVVIDLRF